MTMNDHSLRVFYLEYFWNNIHSSYKYVTGVYLSLKIILFLPVGHDFLGQTLAYTQVILSDTIILRVRYDFKKILV